MGEAVARGRAGVRQAAGSRRADRRWWIGAAAAVALVAAAALGLLASGSQAQPGGGASAPPAGVVEGVVVNPYGQPVAGATVHLSGSTRPPATTDAAGRFHLEGLPPGPRELAVRRPGYLSRTQAVHVGGGHAASVRVVLDVDGASFREALEQVRLRIYREGGYTPLVWFVPRLGVVARFTRPPLRTAQDQLFDMFSAVLLVRDALAPFPYLHDGSALVTEAVTPDEHLLRLYPRGPLLEMLQRRAPSLDEALQWTREHLQLYRNGKGAGRAIPRWEEIQAGIDAVSAELFSDPLASGTYVPDYGLVFQGVRASPVAPVTALTVLGMVLSARLPLAEDELIFVQLDDGEALWAMEGSVRAFRQLVRAGREARTEIDPSVLKDLTVYRNGSPWGG